jgi:hypothetical protein
MNGGKHCFRRMLFAICLLAALTLLTVGCKKSPIDVCLKNDTNRL